MATTEGFPMSRSVASKQMKELALVSCQLPLSSLKENWQRAPGNFEHADTNNTTTPGHLNPVQYNQAQLWLILNHTQKHH
tara:strand:- start:143 stop:382 length:240 start_codon:yes stop_codon:yes gene_type:complete